MGYRKGLGAIAGFLLLGLGCTQAQQQLSPLIDTPSPGVTQEKRLFAKIHPLQAFQSTNLRVILDGEKPEGGYAFQWFRNGEPIEGATKEVLLSEQFRKGDLISVRVTSRAPSSFLPIEVDPIRILNTPPDVAFLRFRPDAPTSADAITIRVQAWDTDKDPLTYRFVWMRNGEAIPNVHSDILSPGLVRRGDTISVLVTPYDGEEWGPERESEIVRIANGAPIVASVSSKKVLVGESLVYDVMARDPDGDPLHYSLSRFPNGMQMDVRTGRITWPEDKLSVGKHQVVVEVADGHGGAAKQVFELTIEKGER